MTSRMLVISSSIGTALTVTGTQLGYFTNIHTVFIPLNNDKIFTWYGRHSETSLFQDVVIIPSFRPNGRILLFMYSSRDRQQKADKHNMAGTLPAWQRKTKRTALPRPVAVGADVAAHGPDQVAGNCQANAAAAAAAGAGGIDPVETLKQVG
jgi:hypothetical protein